MFTALTVAENRELVRKLTRARKDSAAVPFGEDAHETLSRWALEAELGQLTGDLILTAFEPVADTRPVTDELRELPCPGDWGRDHHWLVMASVHGPASPYGCQHCAATATGAALGISTEDEMRAAREALLAVASASAS